MRCVKGIRSASVPLDAPVLRLESYAEYAMRPASPRSLHARRFRFLPPLRTSAARAVATLGLLLSATVSCHEEFDTTRDAPPSATFGDDVYSMFCDRLGASSLNEDLEGISYRSICHHDDAGKYGDEVDEALLPAPIGEKSVRARKLGVAKMRRIAERRSLLVKAFNQIFPDIEIPDPTTKDKKAKIRLLDGLEELGRRMVPLYEGNPYDKGGEALAPATTQALGRLFDELATDEDARLALQQMAGREGYRPSNVGLGAIRSFLTYPDLRNLTKTTLQLFGPDGEATDTLQHMLEVGKREMITARTIVSPLPQLVIDEVQGTLSRPRETSELLRSMMLTEHESFGATTDAPSRFISVRDKRGFAIPFGARPGVVGTVPAPFVDADDDGFADVDQDGRFIDDAGDPLDIDPPFALAEKLSSKKEGSLDTYGRPAEPTYQYVDTSRTLAASIIHDLVPLLDPTVYAEPDDDKPFLSENETIMYALQGAMALYGTRERAVYDFEEDEILPEAVTSGARECDECAPYERFRGEDSPLADLVHAFGQILADPDSDAVMLSMIDLMQNHEQQVARLIGAALHIKEIADQHDQAAAVGQVLPAVLPRENPIWDEMAAVIGRIAEEPGLTAKILGVLAGDELVTPIAGSAHIGETIAIMATHSDEYAYDKNNFNGPVVNISVGPSSLSDPVIPLDFAAPRNGQNRSILQRVTQLIADTRGAKACNKNEAKVVSSLAGITLDWPLTGGYGQCELFEISDLSLFYLRSLLPPDHEKKSEFVLKDTVLLDIMGYLNSFVSPDQLFEDSSGITGMTLNPTDEALNRLVFFGSHSDRFPNIPDFDTVNFGGQTEEFIYKLMEPIGTAVCPVDGYGVPDCPEEDLLRIRDGNTIFALEKRGLGAYLEPLIRVFANVGCSGDGAGCSVDVDRGEQMFLDKLTILNRHWNGPDHGTECSESAPKTSPAYCSGGGVGRYEPILDKSLRSDLIPALHEFAKAVHDVQKITVRRGPKAGDVLTGAQIMEHVTEMLFSTDYASSLQLVNRRGSPATTWADGTPQPQATGYTLIADALAGFDKAFDNPDNQDRKAPWKRARSQLVDAFLAVDGEGTSARFRNPSFAQVSLAIMRVLTEQLNANCPTREQGAECTWAKWDLGRKLSETMSGPLFAAIQDTTEALRTNEEARRELERALTFVLLSASEDDALQGTLASVSDMLQIMSDDERLAPVLRAASVAVRPEADPDGAGCADQTLRVMKALIDDEYDAYHVMDYALPNLVRPLVNKDGEVVGSSPLEIIMDSIADVHRIDAASRAPNKEDDYETIMGTVRDFLVDDTRGFEQFYAIIRKRPQP